jgi:murein L,D-transpeptidase YcbB/YkuD
MRTAAALFLTAMGPAIVAAPQPEALPASLQARIESARSPELRWPSWPDQRARVTAFYQRIGGRPAWTAGAVPTPQAMEVMAKLAAADLKGLAAVDYEGDRWPARSAALAGAGEVAVEAFDVALTVSLLRYASDLSGGRINPAKLGQGFTRTPRKLDLAAFVAELAAAPDPGARLEGIEPPFLPYRTLMALLPRYLELAQRPARPLPAARHLAPGDAYAGAADLTELLTALGDLTPEAAKALPPGRYDPALAEAVQRYQARHGLAGDGRLGPQTLAQLNTPLGQRLAQIRLTLERWRWASLDPGPRLIEVNLPAFNLSALSKKDAGYQTDLWMKVVVGGVFEHETHVLSGKLATVVFRPYWNVPKSIVKSDILPALRRHPGFLARKGYEIVTWYEDPKGALPITAKTIAELAAGRLQLRQKPGPDNALGRVKLLFPNSQGIYLHDTPARAAFGKAQRAQSHGCVRVEHAAELAAWVLRDDPAWTLDKVKEAMAEEAPPQTVAVAAAVQVLFVYGTATVDGSGRVYFYPDLYGNDAQLAKALAAGYPYP